MVKQKQLKTNASKPFIRFRGTDVVVDNGAATDAIYPDIMSGDLFIAAPLSPQCGLAKGDLLLCLSDGETFMGADFSEVGIWEIIKLKDDEHLYEWTGTVTPTTPAQYDIKGLIEDIFDEVDPVYNSGVSFMVDFYFAFNHYFKDYNTGYPTKHFAGSMHRRVSFTIYKPNISGEAFVTSAINAQYESGTWLEYDSDRKFYDVLDDSGTLTAAAFPLSLVAGAANSLHLKVQNGLRDQVGFHSVPNYNATFKMKLRAFELSQDDHTIELI